MNTILHIGVGNFFRAHQAAYTQGLDGWQYVGASLRSARMADGLSAQGNAYTLVIKGGDVPEYRKIDVLREVIVAPQEPARLLAVLAAPETKVVTITVTESGYCLGPDGALDLAHADVAHDLATPDAPRSLIGILAYGLAQRWAAGAEAITVVSCDNLPGNGGKLQAAVAALGEAAGLGDLVTNAVRFPNTMVDRITPATTDALRQEVAQATGWQDAMPVETEAFSEWVIEDDFAGARPAWDVSGAQFVADVEAFEQRKLWLLNGAHSYLAYRGQLAGHTYVHQAINDPVLRGQVKALFAAATVHLPAGIQADTGAYADQLLARFENPSLNHELAQIAQDGSLKLPIRWGEMLRDDDVAGVYLDGLAAWVSWVWQVCATGAALSDPAAERLRTICAEADSAQQACGLLLAVALPDDLAKQHASSIASRLK